MNVRCISIVSKRPYTAIEELARHFQVEEKGDICVAIGGDGTFLEAAQEYDSPILLIRGGEPDSLGFHADTTLGDLSIIIKKLKTGAYVVEKHPKLRVSYNEESFDAVNDVALIRAGPRTVHCRVKCYDEKGEARQLFPGEVRGDGIIVARQIGSTAYNYFAHGPIVFGIDVAVVTPISANYRFSIVSDRDFHIELRKGVGSLQCDGVEITRLQKDVAFTVARSDKTVKIVRLEGFESFSEKLGRLLAF